MDDGVSALLPLCEPARVWPARAGDAALDGAGPSAADEGPALDAAPADVPPLAAACSGGDGADDDGGAAASDAPLEAPATTPGGAQGGAPLRCLDPRHSAACVRCAPPPPDGDLSEYQLIGDPQKKNGEKKLRSLLTGTPEWRDADARLTLAQELEGSPDHANLAFALRAKDCAALRKHSMVALARAWGYRSDVWQHRPAPLGTGAVRVPPKRKARLGGASRAASAQGGAADVDDDAHWTDAVGRGLLEVASPSRRDWPSDPLAVALRGPPGAALLGDAAAVPVLRSLVSCSLVPLARAAASSWAGEHALAAARNCPLGLRRHNLEERLRDNTKVLHLMGNLVAYIDAQRGLLRSWRAQMQSGAPEAGAAAAWSLLRGSEGPMEAVLRMISASLVAGESDSRRIRAEVSVAPLSPAQRAWFAELDDGISGSLRWVAHAQAAGAPMRVARFDAYLEASEVVVELAQAYVKTSLAAFRRRREWMTEMALPPPEVLCDDPTSERNCPAVSATARELSAAASVGGE